MQLFKQPSMAPTRSDIYSCFLVNNFLTHVVVGAGLLLNRWEDLPPTTNQAMHALATTYFGKMHHDDELIRYGGIWYGKALTGLSNDLGQADSAWSTSVLLSTVALTLYEVSTSYYITNLATRTNDPHELWPLRHMM